MKQIDSKRSEILTAAQGNQHAKLFLRLLWITLVISLVGGALIGGAETQVFAKYGAIKKIILPIIYVIFGIFVLTRRGAQEFRLPRFARLLLWAIVTSSWVSLFKSLLLPDQNLQVNFLIQGLLQIYGLILFVYAGSLTVNIDASSLREWTVLAIFGSTMTGISNLDSSPFIMLYIPLTFFLISISFEITGFRRFFLFSIAITSLVMAIRRNLEYQDPSLAWILELSSITFLFLSLFVRPRTRRLIYKFLISLVLITFPFTQLFRLLIGISPKGVTDVTLLQRSFETSEVLVSLLDNPITWLFGLGPGGYLDMTWAPDFRTLISAGRNIEMVDDTHFLTSWILLKLGFIGLSIFIVFIFYVLKSALDLVSRDNQVNPLDFLFSANVIGGVAISVTAGTNFFTNPLLGISIGAVLGRLSIRQDSNTV